jgi:hypothetical protein
MRCRKESSFDIHARQNTDEGRTQIMNMINDKNLENSHQHCQTTVHHMGYCNEKYEAMQQLQTFMQNKRLIALQTKRVYQIAERILKQV